MIYEGAGSIFFDDQYISKEDLNNIEYTKLKTIRDSLAACIKQPGVAIDSLADSSLKVEYVDSKHFTVNPGTAIDKFGRIIYVPSNVSQYGNVIDDPEYHPKYPDRENLPHGKIPNVPTRYYVNIYYNTQQDIVESDTEGEPHYIRIYDSYYISCDDFQAGSGSLPGSGSLGICLGSFEVNTSGNIRFSEITDIRPLLKVLSAGVVSGLYTPSRRIFSKINIASSALNAAVSGYNQWATTSGSQQIKAYIGYMHREGTVSMNVLFCVPTSSQSPTDAYLCVYIYTYDGSLVISDYVNVVTNNYIQDFSLDISGLSPGLYYIRLDMQTLTGVGTFYVKDFTIDVS